MARGYRVAVLRVVFLGNNLVGLGVLKILMASEAEIVGAVLHPPEKRRYGEEILSLLDLPAHRIVEGPDLGSAQTLRRIAGWGGEMAISALFDYILKPGFLELFAHRCVNLHPSLLPYNRGQYPNVWSIIDGTPAGATLHYIDEGVDTGDIIAQKQVPLTAYDTGESLYRRLEGASVELFSEIWPTLREGKTPGHAQSGRGTYHRTRDVEQIDEIDLGATYTAKSLIDIVRARTFPPYRGAYFISGGRRVYLRLELIPEEQIED